jgi:hypothetical protein
MKHKFPCHPVVSVLTLVVLLLVKSPIDLCGAEILTPIEAAKQVGKSVTVEFTVQGAGLNPPVDSEEIYSEPMWTHSNAFIVRFIGPVRAELKKRHVLSLAEHFMHHKVRVTGIVKQLGIDGKLRSAIDVASLEEVQLTDQMTWPEKPGPELVLSSLKKKRVDLRPVFNRYHLDARQQGQRGACQVFALTGVAEYHLAKQGRKADLSEMFLMWAANETAETSRVDGFNQDLLIAGWQKLGICTESLQPYIAKNEPISPPTDKAKRDATALSPVDVLLIKHWASGIGARDDHLQRVFETLQEQNPLTVTLAWPVGIPGDKYLDQDFMFVEHAESTWDKSGHGTMFVGYEINKRYPGGAVFFFRNTWGPEWGDQGYAKISLDLARKLMISAYAVQPRKIEKPPKPAAKKAAT